MEIYKTSNSSIQELSHLTAMESLSLWVRVGISAACAVTSLYLTASSPFLGFLTYQGITFLLLTLAASLVLPHWQYWRQPSLWISLGISATFFLLSFIASIYQGIIPHASQDLLVHVLAISLVLAVVLPHLRLKHYIFSVLLLLAWLIGVSTAMPPLAKQYYLFTAARLIPSYPVLQLASVKYSPGSFPDIQKSVEYVYRTNDPQGDYLKMKEFYQVQFNKKGWVVCGGYSSPDHNQEDIQFCKAVGQVPSVGVGYNKKSSSIGASVGF